MISIRSTCLVAVLLTVLMTGACSRIARLPASFYDGDLASSYERLPTPLQRLRSYR
jgi:hypothetical protein